MKRRIALCLLALLSACLGFSVVYFHEPLSDCISDYLILFAPKEQIDFSEYEDNYYFNELTDLQKQAYALICREIYDFPEQIRTPKLTEDDFNAVHEAIVYDNPELFFLDVTCSMIFKNNYCLYCPAYICGADEYRERLYRIRAFRDEVYSHIPPDADDYEKEKIMHDRLIAFCTYGQGDGDSGLYGAMVNGTAVCSGYARSMQYLLDGMHIRNYLVTGLAGEEEHRENHMWNVVYIGGKPYHLDATWDDGDYKNGVADYAYFNVTGSAISATHEPKKPTDSGCVSLDDNYFVRENRFFSACDAQFRVQFRTELQKQLLDGNESFSVLFADLDVMQQAVALLIEDQVIYRILSDIVDDTDIGMATDYIHYSVNEEMCVLRLDLTENLEE